MKILAFKSSYPGGVNNAPDSGKPYPGGNFVPEIWFILSPGGVNLAQDLGQTIPQWEFLA